MRSPAPHVARLASAFIIALTLHTCSAGLNHFALCGRKKFAKSSSSSSLAAFVMSTQGGTALMYACVRNRAEVVQVLLSHGADTDAYNHMVRCCSENSHKSGICYTPISIPIRIPVPIPMPIPHPHTHTLDCKPLFCDTVKGFMRHIALI